MTPTGNTVLVEKDEKYKNALVIGKGHLGSYLRNAWSCYQWSFDMDDLTESILKSMNPSFIVNAAGKTDLPWCEANPLEAFRCNVSCHYNLLDRVIGAFGENSIPYFSLSSGCVFDGPYNKDGKPFMPYDVVSPACFYTWTKVACDSMLQTRRNDIQLVILRPRQLYSGIVSPRNTLMKLLKYEKLLDTDNSMTSVRTVKRYIEMMVESKGRHVGIYNVAEIGETSPYKVGMMLHKAGLRDEPKLLTKDDMDSWHKPKRVDTVLLDPEMLYMEPKLFVEEELQHHIDLLKENLKNESAKILK